ncbi:hypothetical protein KNE206_73590 [Kitasatospora sp. NE20-6]|uniref:DDE-type integrase/transposase/recombinase n=1 Tax=Kitasatospora sp. NE20-6 TaxID=2859066 RepID=UPI0034DBCA96
MDEAFTGVEGELGTTAACRLTGRSRATHYRRLQPPPSRKVSQIQPSALTSEERAAVLELMNSPEYAELPRPDLGPRAGRGTLPLLGLHDVPDPARTRAVRRAPPPGHPPGPTVSELVATVPSQVFSWDITKAAGPRKGIWYHSYVVIDIFSRCIVGHTVEAAESAEQAEESIRETIERNGIVPEAVHADRGTSMTSRKVSQLLIDPGVTRSHPRPGASDDNPYSEARFKTTKYTADHPERSTPTPANGSTPSSRTTTTSTDTPASATTHRPACTSAPPRRATDTPNASDTALDHPRCRTRGRSTTRQSTANPYRKPHGFTTVSLDLKSSGLADGRGFALSRARRCRGHC